MHTGFRMRAGDQIAGRFVIEREAGAGGMGAVYRAHDRSAGCAVAVKVLHARGPRELDRFLREARVLAELDHPHVVRHVASGTTAEGEPYLVMEWLEGEDLSQRIDRGALTPDDALAALRGACEGLASAHRRGVIHRDIKPSNLFLPGGDVRRVKVLDFGVARRAAEARGLTGTGALVGTPAYMAPEQARGASGVTAAVDVFALGCVLFESIAARPAFVGENLMAVLAKILLDEAPALGECVPGVDPAVERLVARLLAKLPGERPGDASELLGLLDALDLHARPDLVARPSSPPAALTSNEQRVVSVMLAGVPSASADDVADTLPAVRPDDALASRVAPFGARLETLANGAIVALLAGEGTPVEHAARAARCALALRKALPDAPMVLVTGRSVVAGRLPMGAVIDRAAVMLRTIASSGSIRIDENTAGLVDRRFDVSGDAVGLVLRGERDATDTARTVLGRGTPCIGREREIAVLEGLLDECVGESVSRAVLVTATAGTGKSRLLQEFTARLAKRPIEPELLVGRGDSSSAGSPFALVASLLRRACRVDESEPVEVRRRRVRARIGRHVPAETLPRVAAFLAEVIGAPFDDAEVPSLRNARQDAQVMGDSITSALLDWLSAECAAGPVVVLLDDLHWGDLPSVRLFDHALRALREAPLLVAALARPEVHTTFPALWSAHDPTEVRLPALTRKSAERLVREVLGEHTDAALMARVVERSEGNAFFLEEIVRAIGDNHSLQTIPDTVLGMVQARFDALDEPARRALRAASVFGERFYRAGVTRLLGENAPGSRDWIDPLVAREMIVAVPDARLGGETGFQFRHALVRDAAYAMLTDADRALGHRLAATWLASVGETEPAVMARHFELGGDTDRAVEWYASASSQALEGSDLDRALTWSRRAIELGAQGRSLGQLWLTQANVHSWRSEYALMLDAAVRARAHLDGGSAAWYEAVAQESFAQGYAQRFDDLSNTLQGMLDTEPLPGAEVSRLKWLVRATIVWVRAGNPSGIPRWLIERVAALAKTPAGEDPDARRDVRVLFASPLFGMFDIGVMADEMEAGAIEFERSGDLRNATQFRSTAGFMMTESGQFERAEGLLREAIAQADRLGLGLVGGVARHNLAFARSMLGHVDEAHEMQLKALETFERLGNWRLEAASHLVLGEEAYDAGDVARAERHGRRALEVARGIARILLEAEALLAECALAAGDLDTARLHAEAAMDHYAKETTPMARSVGYVAMAKLEIACGRTDEAERVVRQGLATLEGLARAIHDPNVKRSTLHRVRQRAQLIQLGATLGIDTSFAGTE